MEPRIYIREKGNEAYNTKYDLVKYVSKSSYEKFRLSLIENKVSQIKVIAYCVGSQHMKGVDL